MEVLKELSVLRPGQDGVGMEGFLHWEALVVVEGLGPLGGGGGHSLVIADSAHVKGLVRETSGVQYGG